MSNKKEKKKIKLFIILLVFILIIFLIILQRTRIVSKEGILEMLISGMNNLNYTEEAGDYKVQVFGKHEKKTYSDSEKYFDYERKKSIELYSENMVFQEYSNEGIKEMSYYENYISPYFENDEYNYKYVGKKKVDGKKCIVINFSKNNKSTKIDLYIDNTTKLIIKIEKYINTTTGKKEKLSEEKYNFSSGLNTIENVTISETELSKYSEMQY